MRWSLAAHQGLVNGRTGLSRRAALALWFTVIVLGAGAAAPALLLSATNQPPGTAQSANATPGQAEVWGWGNPASGRLGDNTVGCDPSACTNPVQILGLPDVVAVDAGDRHNLALAVDGTVWSWGSNDFGQLGLGTYDEVVSTPQQIPGLTNVVAISAGAANSMALRSDGTVWRWGFLFYVMGVTRSPVQVSGLTGVVALAAGSNHQLVLKADGTVWGWGYNYYGELGNNSTSPSAVPVRAFGLSGVVGIAAGYTHSAAVRQDGTVWTWGGNAYGQLGLGNTKNQKRPIQVSTLASIGMVAAGGYHTLAVRSDGQQVWAFGRNQSGQLGDGTTTNRLAPVLVPSLSGLAAVDGGDAFSLAPGSDGSVWGWGAGASGQLDRGSTADSVTPIVTATSLGPVEAVTAGGSHALARRVAPEPPVVALTDPQPDQVLFDLEDLVATASHSSGIASVEFLVEGQVVGHATTEPFTVSWDTTTIADGTHALKARATANDGQTGESGEVSVLVDNALSPSERLEADLGTGGLSVDEYALHGIHLLVAPQLLPSRYWTGGPVPGETGEILRYLGRWNDLLPATRDEITAILSQPFQGSLYGAVPVGQGQASMLEGEPPLGQCEEVESGSGQPGTGWKCHYDTAHFTIYYTLQGTSLFEGDSISETPANADGVPMYVVDLGQSLEDAYGIYTGQPLAYPAPTTGDDKVPVVIWNTWTAHVFPNLGGGIETIAVPLTGATPYTAHHELFHVFQYPYIADLKLLQPSFGPLWWMEATANWAAGYVARSGDYGSPSAYAEGLPHFLATPSESLSSASIPFPVLGSCPCRQYGAFILAEYLAEYLDSAGYNAAVIRQTWEAYRDGPLQLTVEPVVDAVAQSYDKSLSEILPDFARANYLLEYDDHIGTGASDVETVWRETLEGDDRTRPDPNDPDDPAPARPARDLYHIADGQVVSDELSIRAGGAAYVELVPNPLGSEGQLAITVSSAPSELRAHVLPLTYPDPPAPPVICPESDIFIEQGNGSMSVPIAGGCEYVVVIFSHVDAASLLTANFTWSATFTLSGCTDAFDRVVAEGWGTGPLGAWETPTAGISVDGSVGRIDHQSAAVAIPNAAFGAGSPIEVLMKWRVVPDGTGSWQVEVTISDGTPFGDPYAGWFFAHSPTFGTYLGASDGRQDNPPQSGTNWFEADAAGLPSPAGGIWMWARVLIDDYGAYVRFWPDGSAEPVTTAPLASHWGLGGRGERWHAYEETGVPKVHPSTWNRLWISAGSTTTLFEIDSIQMLDQPCPN